MTSRHALLTVEGFTHASSVIPVVRWSAATSPTVTLAVLPLNCSARPNFAVVAQAALTRLPVRLLPDASAVVGPDPSSNAYAATSSGIVEPVVTVAAFEYGPRLLAPSSARTM